MLHCVTQPTCFHDIMWWFNSAMEQYRPLIPEGAPHNASSQFYIITEYMLCHIYKLLKNQIFDLILAISL